MSCLTEILKNLKESSKEAIETLDKFSDFKQYLHIERPIEKELHNLINNVNSIKSKQLILVCGSVGDGKSHLISYLKTKYQSLFNNFELHNDATESLEPTKTAMETLNNKLNPFCDEKINEISNYKLIIAINLGTLNNFINSEYIKNFTKLKDYIENKKILETTVVNNIFDNTSTFHFVNFTDYHLFSLREEGIKSDYIEKIFNKIVDDKNDKNYFYNSYKENCLNCEVNYACPIKHNYEFLQKNNNKKQIIDKLIESVVKYKIIISTRELLNFIYEIIVGSELDNISVNQIKNKIKKLTISQKINLLTKTILFENKRGGKVFEKIMLLDPLNKRKEITDNLLIKLNTTKNISEILSDSEFEYNEYIKSIVINEIETEKDKFEIIKYLLRNHSSTENNIDYIYTEFINNLYLINKNPLKNQNIKNLYKDIRIAIYNWNGENIGDKMINIFIGKKQFKYKISQKLDIIPKISNVVSNENELNKFLPYISLTYSVENTEYKIELDYFLYELLIKVKNGYNLNKKDINNNIKFDNIIKEISFKGKKNEEIIIEDLVNNLKFKIQKDEFDSNLFEYKEIF